MNDEHEPPKPLRRIWLLAETPEPESVLMARDCLARSFSQDEDVFLCECVALGGNLTAVLLELRELKRKGVPGLESLASLVDRFSAREISDEEAAVVKETGWW
jgi:hypothetical protein